MVAWLVIVEWSTVDNDDPPDETGASPVPPEAAEEGDLVEAVQVAKTKAKPKDLSAHLKKEHVNIVFIGHVDAGKSTIGGRVL